MTAVFNKMILIVILFSLVSTLVLANGEKNIDLVSPSDDPQIQFGLSQLKLSLENEGYEVNIKNQDDDKASLVIIVGTPENFKNINKAEEAIKKLSTKPESFAITRIDKNKIAVIGRDAAGAMYGTLDIIDQVDFSDNFSWDSIVEKNKSPYLKLRGVNPFLHVQAMLDTTSWYFSDAFWEDYLNRLARTRHNFLDIHAAYDLGKTNMPNIFSFFFTDEVYPNIEIPVGREQIPVILPETLTKKIFKRFQVIVRMAAMRGIKTGLMNYNTAVQVDSKNLGGQELIDYTSRSVKKLLESCPDLWIFGFRVGESGQSEDFFQKAYLDPAWKTRPDINIYTRTWGADAVKLREMGESLGKHLFVEIKYNGEQMGLPYPAINSPIEGNLPTSYSFEDYTTLPQPFKIIWQIRTNGTHRVFRWGNSDFVRRTVKSCSLGNAAGFTAEPMTAYFPLSDFLHNPNSPHYNSVSWMPQRNWIWYEMWGRLAYDPDLPDEFFKNKFKFHYGKKAGSYLFEAMSKSSKIVPMILAYHRLGPDHRQMAPELETGNDQFKFNDDEIFHGSLKDFYLTTTLDREHMYSIAEYVDAYLDIAPGTPWSVANVHAGGDSPDIPQKLYFPSARFGPDDAASFWFDAAAQSLAWAAKAEKVRAVSNEQDYNCAIQDVKAAAYLGRYYAYKTLGTRDLAFFHRDKDFGRLQSAEEYIHKAISEWDSLSIVTGNHYKPFPDWLRMKTDTFTWKEEGKLLSRDIIELEREIVEVRKMKPFIGGIPATGFTPVREAVMGSPLKIPLFVYSRDRKKITLFYRREGKDSYQSVPFKSSSKFMVYEAEIPVEELSKPGKIEYFIELETYGYPNSPGIKVYTRRWFLNWVKFDFSGSRKTFPEGAPQNSFNLYVHPKEKQIRVDDISVTTDTVFSEMKTANIKIKASDPLGVSWITLHYKGLPSFLPWQSKSLIKAGDSFEGSFPVESEGAIYYIEVGNIVGQAIFYPDLLKTVPYMKIPGWVSKD